MELEYCRIPEFELRKVVEYIGTRELEWRVSWNGVVEYFTTLELE